MALLSTHASIPSLEQPGTLYRPVGHGAHVLHSQEPRGQLHVVLPVWYCPMPQPDFPYNFPHVLLEEPAWQLSVRASGRQVGVVVPLAYSDSERRLLAAQVPGHASASVVRPVRPASPNFPAGHG